ncbi:precorrin-8X methylmutase [Prochlorococcus marinus]|uniref:Precorrin-8X methylmutase n=1 Tax=Prochlorococcus marinus XMU1408 TaxID=2213228 RepID=A0A318RBD6_PROMR|nr:precorrin-8X methylmutase [Prochlorococcus marinus]MBW3042895.1 precorrin-8X methylmutase [Prochlorococcus marinus str. XMU1408]PYE00252.1 precorrin-8X methylmutase [Prochlorococcus marinus XMU1408]
MKTPEHPIFLESVKYIRSKLWLTGLDHAQQSILERIIHSSGDFSLQSCLRFSPSACDDAINALQNGAMILTDTYMAKAAISPMAKRTINSDIQCILGMAPESIASTWTTRSAIGMRNIWLDFEEKDHLLHSPIVVIGSSPTALISILDLVEKGYKKPSLIIGMPVGFIGVSESKNRLLKSECPYIVLEGSKGGASLAAATINSLLRVADN